MQNPPIKSDPPEAGTFTRAISRKPGLDFAQGLTESVLGEPSYERILLQHEHYVRTLESLGLEVRVLEPLAGHPDAYFVEDAAIVLRDVAVITRPGATERRGEEQAIEPVLAQHREIARIEAPGTVDGGDVLVAGSHVFIGVSARTNAEGCRQLGAILDQHGFAWTGIPVEAGLHLKSSISYIGGRTLLVTEQFADHEELRGYAKILLDPEEEYAGNTLLINECLLTPAGFPNTKQQLEGTGRRVIELDMSEARKMDGGLSCMSLRF